MDEAAPQIAGGRYVLEGIIGHGGHSVIYRAADKASGTPVAIKILKTDVGQGQELARRLLREQKALRALDGTEAVKVHGVTATTRGAVCLVMELLEGRDLYDELVLREEAGELITADQLIRWIEPIVNTLEVAHDVGIIHRDLKPGNIFVTSDGAVRLLDFDLAYVAKSEPITKAGMVLGSPSYIAPEVWKGNSSALDLRVDIYSLAAIIFRILTGRVPFEAGGDLVSMRRRVLGAERPSLYELRPDLPSLLDGWVEQALAVNREERFAGVRAMWVALVRALGTEGQAAEADSERQSVAR